MKNYGNRNRWNAKNNFNRKPKKYGNKDNSDKSLTKFAFNLGRVSKGIAKGNTQVAESFNAGKSEWQPKKRKPLC
ncbi:MAG: hypothetical protein LBQ05_01290 [Christensenellaceae bacterium]|jgi:hypothetical protein|nr:hypothetical protein [Christensenellaceae bacterium]